MSETLHPNQSGRDLSRAHRQRGVAAVLMRELTEGVFEQDYSLSQEDISRMQPYDATLYYKGGPDTFWATAFSVADEITIKTGDIILTNCKKIDKHLSVNRLLTGLTHYLHLETIMYEGMNTASRFPLNLARAVCDSSDASKNLACRPRSLSQLADLLERQDFKHMIDQSLVTKNGYWRDFSNSIAPISKHTNSANFRVTKDSISFSTAAVDAMRQSLREVNGNTSDQNDVEKSSSSGCPARHNTPRISDQEDMRTVELLAKAFEKSPERLMEFHEVNVVHQALGLITRGLRESSEFFEEYTYDRYA